MAKWHPWEVGVSIDFCLYLVSVSLIAAFSLSSVALTQRVWACPAEVKWPYSKDPLLCHPFCGYQAVERIDPHPKLESLQESTDGREVAEAEGFLEEQLVLRRNICKLLRRPQRIDSEMDDYLILHISGLLFKLYHDGRHHEEGPWESLKNISLLFSSLTHFNKFHFILFITKK